MTHQNYDAKSIQVLEGLEAVRKRPGMYIGSTGSKGLHHLIWEIVDNAIDEAMAGYAKRVSIRLAQDGSIEVSDDGRGIPTQIHSKTQKSTVETVLTILHAGGKFDSNSYKVSGGLHGVGASVVNALSKQFEVWVKRDNKIFYQKFINGGHPVADLKVIGEAENTGTRIKFYPDDTIFETTEFDFDLIKQRAKQLAYLNKGIIIDIENRRHWEKHEFVFEGGLLEYVRDLNHNKDVLIKDIIYADEYIEIKDIKTEKINKIKIEVALQYNNSYSSNVITYANNISTTEGGTHEQGFNDAMIRVLNTYALTNNKFKNEVEKIAREDIREGLVAIISIKHPDPIFEGQTKGKLGNTDARKAVNIVFSKKIERYLNENPTQASLIIEKVLLSQRARFAAQKAREAIRKTDPFEISSLPGKLTDCSSTDPVECELYIVEGDSAGGSAKLGRDRKIQAILPLRGKIINVEKARINKVFENQEIISLITAIGTGIEDDLDLTKLRYHKIIIMTDADVDGSHIRILLLTFFYRYFMDLVKSGFIYIAQPPLYKIQIGKNAHYFYLEEEKERFLKTLDENSRFTIQRYKGLGEMDAEQLWETTMDPNERKMLQVQVYDVEKANEIFSTLMGQDVLPRKEFISKNAKYAKNIDL